MILVVEANIVFQALIKRGFIFRLIKKLSKSGIKLHSPEFILEELRKREERLLRYSGLSKAELDFLINLLFKKIEIISKSKYSMFLPEALEIFPEHSKDAPYFALTLSSDEFELWSDEDAFKHQSKVEIFDTKRLMKLLGI